MELVQRIVWLGVLLAFGELVPVESAKILFLLPVASKSHHNVFEPLLKALAGRGHDIIFMSPYKPSSSYPNIEHVMPATHDQIFGNMPSAFELRKMDTITMTAKFADMFDIANHAVYQNERVKQILKEEKFDLVFIDIFLSSCAVGMLPDLTAPYVYLTTAPATNDITRPAGTHFPPSFIPDPFLPYTDQMSFTQRFGNTVMQWVATEINEWFLFPRTEGIYRQYMGQNTPSMAAINRNVNMIMMNSHFAMTYPRPLLPDIVEVGGMHCRPSGPLPKDLEDFIQGSGEHGFIFFSLGSIAKGSDMPEETRLAFLAAFGKLKQRVIWKWENDGMEGLPKNVMIKKFLPQQDLLGHPKIRLFMTHGGLLSIQEAVYHGVPLLTIPLFADQDLNALKAEKAGFSLTLEINGLTEVMLDEKIQQVLREPRFAERSRHLSNLTRDQSETPLDKAVYWSEYLIRHKGAPHLRSPARDLNAFQYHSLDVIGVVVSILLLTLSIVVILVKKVIQLCFGASVRAESKQTVVVGGKKNN